MSHNLKSAFISPIISLLDGSCRIVWISDTNTPYTRENVIGTEPWVHVADKHQSDRLQAAILRTLVQQTPQQIDADFPHVGRWRLDFFHVALPLVRMALFARRIPPEVTLLTEQEAKICLRLAAGEHTPEIADALDVSRSTVSAHRANIARKLKIATDELVSWSGAHREWL